MSNRRGRPPYDDLLTPAEWRTVNAVRHGFTNREIAERRGISLDAVKFHVANIIAKLGARNRKALKHWIGAPKNSAVRSEEKIVVDKSGILAVGQIARSVANIEQAEQWYRDVLDLTHLYTFGTLAFFDCGGTRLMLSQGEEGESAESLLYLQVGNIEFEYQQLQQRGVEFTNAPHMIHKHENGVEEWMAFFEDPEGRPLAIMSSVAPV